MSHLDQMDRLQEHMTRMDAFAYLLLESEKRSPRDQAIADAIFGQWFELREHLDAVLSGSKMHKITG